MDICIISNILSFTSCPRKYMHLSKTFEQAILDYENKYIKQNTNYSRSIINIAALNNDWYIVFLRAQKEDIDWILHLCIAFGQRQLAHRLCEKYADSHNSILCMTQHKLFEYFRSQYSAKNIIGFLTSEQAIYIKQHPEYETLTSWQRNLLNNQWGSTIIQIDGNIPYWEYYPDVETQTYNMKFVTPYMLQKCLSEECCNNNSPHILEVLRYFGFESLSLLEFLQETTTTSQVYQQTQNIDKN